jgi:hypothetical protein
VIAKNFKEITFQDIENLVENEVRESRILEYKSELPHEGESSKIPFLAEVSALANTEGGDMIFGVGEDKGSPTQIVGVDVDDPDKETLRLENSIRTGLEPRIQNVAIKVVSNGEKQVVVLRVGKSWNAPHRVQFKDHSKFYKRNSAGKYPMDVSELRTAFVLSEQIAERIRKFKEQRVLKLKIEDELPVSLYSGAKLILHLIPLSAFAETSYLSIEQENDINLSLRPLGSSGWNSRYNLDGIVAYSGSRNEQSRAYTQLFRNGIVEAVSSLGCYDENKFIASEGYEEEIISALPVYMKTFKKFEIDPPIYFFISFIGIKEYRFAVNRGIFWNDNERLSDRDDLLLPEGIIMSLDFEPHKQFRPFFDMVWNAYGFKRSFNYDENGNWVGQRR